MRCGIWAMSLVAAMAVSTAARPAQSGLNDALVPHRADRPRLPKVDYGACPFEGCQFGAWKARRNVQLFSTWKADRHATVVVHKGESVRALTGVNIVRQPSEIRITAPISDYQLEPGDTVFGYMNLGEGVFNAWFKGFWLEQFDGSGIATPDGTGCLRNCNAILVRRERVEWWVQIKTRQGAIGWTRNSQDFDGADALAGAR